MIEVIPAILTDSPPRFKELIRKLEPYTSRIHIDIADGVFVPNTTIKGYEELKEIEAAVKFDVHLMVEKPEEHLKEWLHTHADRFIIHAESYEIQGHLVEQDALVLVIEELHKNGRKIGLAFNPETDLGKFREIVKKVNIVQFMTVHPGFQGGQFVAEVVDKIAKFHEKYPDIMIMADGGITPETVPDLVKAGASLLVSGSYIVKSQNMEKAIEELKIAARNKEQGTS